MYQEISKIYDLSMKDVNYKQWVDTIENIISFSNVKVKNILELGCGTGNVTLQLLKSGYEVVGIDSSVEMLHIAKEKIADFGSNIILINQDIANLDFEVYQIDMIIACNDVFNYIYNEKDLKKIFDFAYRHLKKDGILLFDYSSKNKFENILDGNVFCEDFGDYYYVWKNFYDRKNAKLLINIDIFQLNSDNSYDRYVENQVQVTYSPKYISNLLSKYPFESSKFFCDFNLENKDFTSCNRIFFHIKK